MNGVEWSADPTDKKREIDFDLNAGILKRSVKLIWMATWSPRCPDLIINFMRTSKRDSRNCYVGWHVGIPM